MIRMGWHVRAAMTLGMLMLSIAACVRPRAAPAPSPAQADSMAADSAARADSIAFAARLLEVRPRHAARPVPLTSGFQLALRAATRTEDGRPGPRYWQQRVDYRIDAEIDPATAKVQGVETIVYHNRSPDALEFLRFNLYQNVFAPGAQRVRRMPVTGGVALERVSVEGVDARPDGPPPSWEIDGTLMTLRLREPLQPGRRMLVEIAWNFTVPPAGAPRTAQDRKDVFLVAQWFPQVAAYDDVRGWHDRPYWGNGEFYLEYGDFEVSITAPEGWIVGATGVLENADEVLHANTRERLAHARESGGIVNVVTADDHAANTATVREPGGQLTWRFTARNVRDFAFATSNRYLWDAARAILPDANGDAREDTILVHALYRPAASTWREAARYLRHAVTFHAQRWHPYTYPHLTAAEGPIGGMEYPMLTFIGAPAEPQALYEVISHEVAHQWWPMMVGSNETDHAWQDEGIASWVEALSVDDLFPGSDPHGFNSAAYLQIAGTDEEKPIERQADLYGPGIAYGVATYSKPAMLFRSLSAIIGERTLHTALRVYADRWRLAHPTPFDLFNTIEDVAGRDLDWFWNPWFIETAVLDQAIASVDLRPDSAGRERVTVLVEDQGTAPMPVTLVFTTRSGRTHPIELPVEPWLQGRVRQLASLVLDEPVARIDIDPGRWFADVDRSDNSWVRAEVESRRSDEVESRRSKR